MSGKLIMNAVVIYDRQSRSLRSQLLATAADGPLAGAKMELLPSQFTTWGVWIEQHPDTKILDHNIGRGAGRDPYTSYYNSDRAGVLYDHAPVVVPHDPLGDAAAAFSRTLDSRTPTFETLDRATMRDVETSST